MSRPTVVGVIPARYASTRFPGKPLALIAGKPMIQWVYERALKAKLLDQLLVATDDERIFSAVVGFGGKVEMTPGDLPSGTDRTAYVARKLQADILVNIQGDEPLIDPLAVDLVAGTLIEHDDADMATLVHPVDGGTELANPNKVRVVLDCRGRALYFSRAVIPYLRDAGDQKVWASRFTFYEHIGIYAYRRDALFRLTALAQSPLEKAEKLEQLRALENGMVIQVGICRFESLGVDVPEDLAAVEKKLQLKAYDS